MTTDQMQALAARLRDDSQDVRSGIVLRFLLHADLDAAADLIEQMAQQEPVAWMVKAHGSVHRLVVRADVADELAYKAREFDPSADALSLYLAPPAREPLSDEQIFDLAEPFGAFEYGDAQGDKRIAFARAIEAVHGIGGEK
jgi:hypothetical protein